MYDGYAYGWSDGRPGVGRDCLLACFWSLGLCVGFACVFLARLLTGCLAFGSGDGDRLRRARPLPPICAWLCPPFSGAMSFA